MNPTTLISLTGLTEQNVLLSVPTGVRSGVFKSATADRVLLSELAAVLGSASARAEAVAVSRVFVEAASRSAPEVVTAVEATRAAEAATKAAAPSTIPTEVRLGTPTSHTGDGQSTSHVRGHQTLSSSERRPCTKLATWPWSPSLPHLRTAAWQTPTKTSRALGSPTPLPQLLRCHHRRSSRTRLRLALGHQLP